MATDDFVYDDEAVKEEKKKNKRGGGLDLMAIDSGKCYLFFMSPLKSHKHRSPFIENTVHKLKIKGKFYEATAASNEGEDDPVADLSWKFYEAFKNSKNKAKKEAWQDFKPKNETYANAIKLKKQKSKKTGKTKWVFLEAGPVRLPVSAAKVLVNELDEIGTAGVCHPDKGKIMMIADNGKSGLDRRYDVCKFLDKKAKLVEKDIVDLEEVKASMIDLKSTCKPYSEDDITKLYKALKKKHKKLFALLKDDEEEIDEAEVEEEVEDDDDTELDDQNDDDDDDDDDVKVDEDDDDDDDDDDEDDDDSDDDDDDDEDDD